MAFRAIAYQETLQNAGIPPDVARAHAKAMEEFIVSELVTHSTLISPPIGSTLHYPTVLG